MGIETNPIHQLEALTEARSKATPGPWAVNGDYIDGPNCIVSDCYCGDDTRAFIALAGSLDLPALLARMRALETVAKAADALLFGPPDEYAKATLTTALEVLDESPAKSPRLGTRPDADGWHCDCDNSEALNGAHHEDASQQDDEDAACEYCGAVRPPVTESP